MFFSQLLTLEKSFSPIVLESFDKYMSSLTPTASALITARKLSHATGENYATCLKFLKACLDLGLMHRHFALLCPECGNILKIVDSLDALVNSEGEYCHKCDEIIQFNETNLSNNIEVIFSLKDAISPFVNGQQLVDFSMSTERQAVAPPGNLSEAVQFQIVGYDDLFSPTQIEYQQLLLQLAEIKQPQKTTTATGTTLESFCKYLFGLCKIYRTTDKFRNETNQIDTFIRIASYIPDGLFGIKSNYFAIECKNESTTPKGEYLSKLHSILHIMGAELGIIISRQSPPATFPKLAHDMYLKDNMCFIWFDLRELDDIVKNQKNLLDVMDQKILTLKTNATRSLSEIGLY